MILHHFWDEADEADEADDADEAEEEALTMKRTACDIDDAATAFIFACFTRSTMRLQL